MKLLNFPRGGLWCAMRLVQAFIIFSVLFSMYFSSKIPHSGSMAMARATGGISLGFSSRGMSSNRGASAASAFLSPAVHLGSRKNVLTFDSNQSYLGSRIAASSFMGNIVQAEGTFRSFSVPSKAAYGIKDAPIETATEEENSVDGINSLDFEDEEDKARNDLMSPMGPLECNNNGDVWLPQQIRPRRNRKTKNIRKMLQESSVRTSNLVFPMFVHDKEGSPNIPSMPGLRYYDIPALLAEVEESMKLGVKSFILFPVVSHDLRSEMGEESYNDEGLIPTAVRALKEAYPSAVIFTDVALDPYTLSAMDGIKDEDSGVILNDLTVQVLCKQALSHARAGADFISPSDMMDGRVLAIRDVLDAEGFTDTSIMSYTSKFASKLYSPFRQALKNLKSDVDKATFQQDPSNAREALIEANLDIAEGADVLLVKPGTLYLDIVSKLREKTNLPLGVYHVSGEYAMIKAAAEKGYIDEKQVAMEQIKALRRAGADLIVTYYAKELAQWMYDDFHGEKGFAELSF